MVVVVVVVIFVVVVYFVILSGGGLFTKWQKLEDRSIVYLTEELQAN